MNINAFLNEEYNSRSIIRAKLEKDISVLPKGSVQPKVIRGITYYYLQFRDGKKVKTQYIPKQKVPEIENKIEERKRLEDQLKSLLTEQEKIGYLIGKHTHYKPVKNVNNEEYTLFMSTVAHDYKRLDKETFLEKYQPSHYRGLQKKYLKGFIDWMNGSFEVINRKGNDLILDPYTYYMYFTMKDRSVLQEELKCAIPEFLNQGLLITTMQEAVHGS